VHIERLPACWMGDCAVPRRAPARAGNSHRVRSEALFDLGFLSTCALLPTRLLTAPRSLLPPWLTPAVPDHLAARLPAPHLGDGCAALGQGDLRGPCGTDLRNVICGAVPSQTSGFQTSSPPP
jgi:hypothetical protein